MSTQFHEAPASANVRVITPAGYVWQITTRSTEMHEVLDRIQQIEKYCVAHNWQPVAKGPAPATATAPAPATNGSTPMCPHHHTPMRPSKHKPNGWYCPKKNGNGFCKQTA